MNRLSRGSALTQLWGERAGLRTKLGLGTYGREMLTLVELPFSSFTVGGTEKLTVDSGTTQISGMSHEVRELRPTETLGGRPLTLELAKSDL